MKTTGVVLLILGALAFLIGFNMDTSVVTTLGDRRVHNIGLMNDRQNFIIFAAVLAVIGAIFIARSGSNKRTQINSENFSRHFDDTRKFPFCAEIIKNDEIICRFCQKELPPTPEPLQKVNTPFTVTNLMPVTAVKVSVWNYIVIFVGVYVLLFALLPKITNDPSGGIFVAAIFWISLIFYCLQKILRARKKGQTSRPAEFE